MPKRIRVPNINVTRKARPRPLSEDSPEVTPRPIPPETWNLNPEPPDRPWTNTVEGPPEAID